MYLIVVTVLDLNEVYITRKNAKILWSLLSRVSGPTGGWRCCLGATGNPQLLPATPKDPSSYNSLLYWCFGGGVSNQHKIWAAGGKSAFV